MSVEDLRQRLRQQIADTSFPNYIYGYPSKRAYRGLDPPLPLRDVWQRSGSEINLYVHIPFCNYRCTFCTLFLTTSHTEDLVEEYLGALRAQIDRHAALLGERQVTSLYIGGGTPTVLLPAQFEALFTHLRRRFPSWAPDAEISVEGTPDSLTPEILSCLRDLGVNRVSTGLQSLDPEEMRRAGRRYPVEVAYQAIDHIRDAGFENFNVDLIYGLEGQQVVSWTHSLDQAVAFGPATITLYAAVFRPLSGIHKLRQNDPDRFAADSHRYALYDHSVETLRRQGYVQESFVRFTRWSDGGYQQEASEFSGVPLLGLGAGARTYAGRVHYATDFAVRKRPTLEIIRDFIATQRDGDQPVRFGFVLDDEERRRRYVILNLLIDQLRPSRYRSRFEAELEAEFADELSCLEAEGCIDRAAVDRIRLTPRGFKYSNIIGGFFYSPRVRDLETAYDPK